MSAAAGGRLARLLALVPWLMAHEGIPIAECAADFGVSEAQLERDLWLLVVCGVPGYGPDQLVDIDFWDDGRIHVIDPQTLARPLRLNHEEALALIVALRMLAQLPGVEDRGAITSAAAKLERAASEGGSERVVAIEVDVAPDVTQAVDAALAEHRELTVRYASATRDEITSRVIRPRRLFTVDGISYLDAHCMSAGAFRTFRLDRVLSAELGGPDPGSIEDSPTEPESDAPLPSGSLSAVLALAPGARWITDVHPVTEVEDEGPDGLVRITLPLHSLDWGARLVLSLGGAAIAVAPPELILEVARAAREALAAYPDPVR